MGEEMRGEGCSCVHAASLQEPWWQATWRGVRVLLQSFYVTDSDARRTQFTEEDEEHLSTWIAAKIPYKETGGRTGNRLYQQLCEMASLFVLTFSFMS